MIITNEMCLRRVIVAATVVAMLSVSPLLGGEIKVVTNTNDFGPGSLREAVIGGGVITFDLPGPGPHVIGLSRALDSIYVDLSIINDRASDEAITIQGTLSFQILYISGGNVLVAGLTLRNGAVGEPGYGGAIGNSGGILTLRNCTISDNSGYYGGAIFNGYQLTMNNCTMEGNSSPYIGGAIYNESGASLTVTNCTFINNVAAGLPNAAGGAIRSDGSTSLVNCTFSGNSAESIGGAVFFGPGQTIIRNCTFNNNSAPLGGVSFAALFSSTIEMVNTIFRRGAAAGENFYVSDKATATSLGHNISDDSAGGGAGVGPGGFLDGPEDQRNTNPRLLALADNGGPTRTHALLSTSPAIDAGDDDYSASIDQRGYSRVGTSDIGAFEFGGVARSSLANISTRLRVQEGDNALIGGFILTGSQPKTVLVRAIGPSLNSILTGALADPILELHGSSGGVIVNDNWRSDQEAEIMATLIPPSDDLESAIVTTLPANNSAYTAVVRGVNSGTGIGLVEVYDLDGVSGSVLANISTRGYVQTQDNVLIGGLIVLGQDSLRVIVRAIGPSLPVSGALSDPTLDLRDGNGTLVMFNDNWRTDQEAEIMATGIPPSSDLESAIVEDLAPGSYTAIVRGVNNATGNGLVEVYSLP